jgi:hypothetical protein
LNKKILALTLVLLLTTIYISSVSISPIKAQSTTTGWITSYDIYELHTSRHLASYTAATGNQSLEPISPGEDIKVVFTINVFTAGSGDLKLSTSLRNPPQGQYWQLSADSIYTLGSNFNPNSQQASFNWVVGTFTMTVSGTVPTSSSQTTGAPVNLVTLYGPTSGIPLDQITISSQSAEMTQFNTLYNQKADHLKSLQSSGVAQGYVELYQNVLTESRLQANAGQVAGAIDLLNQLNISDEPASSTTQALFIPIVGVLAAIVVVFAVLFLRVRGKVGYFQLVVEDQIKDLEGITMRISKIDRASSSSLESIKDRLKNLVGM